MPEEFENAEQRMIDFNCPYCGKSVSFPGMDADTAQDCPFCLAGLMVPRESCEVGPRFPLPITTPRLVLRRLQFLDADALLKISTDEAVIQYLSWNSMEAEDVREWLEKDSKLSASNLTEGLWLAIEHAGSGNCIGAAYIKYRYGTNQQLDFIVVIERSHQRQGFGSEAVHGLLNFGFHNLFMRRITASCDDRNEAFMGLAAKMGLRQEGHFYGDKYFKGEWVNNIYYAVLKDEYNGLNR